MAWHHVALLFCALCFVCLLGLIFSYLSLPILCCASSLGLVFFLYFPLLCLLCLLGIFSATLLNTMPPPLPWHNFPLLFCMLRLVPWLAHFFLDVFPTVPRPSAWCNFLSLFSMPCLHHLLGIISYTFPKALPRPPAWHSFPIHVPLVCSLHLPGAISCYLSRCPASAASLALFSSTYLNALPPRNFPLIFLCHALSPSTA